jgi:hypothetical protein
MYQFLIKNGFKIAVYFSSAVVLIFLAMAMFTGPRINIESGDYSNVSQFNFGLVMAIICLFAIIGISAYFTLNSIFTKKADKGYLRKLSLGFGSIFLVLAVLMRTSSNASINKMVTDFGISPSINGVISSGIIIAILATIIAVGLIIYLEVRKAFKA